MVTMGTLLPAFEFIALLASDEFGAVYLSNQRSLGRDVAIKVLAPYLSDDPLSKVRFESACRAMAQLKHPNLVGIYNSGSIEGMLYFVMEFVPGKSLGHSTKGQSIHFKQALLLAEGICAGLVHAHQHQIIHGNLNLWNILLNNKAEPKLTNFGLSHHHDKTASPSVITSRFVAPEVIRNAGPTSPQSDIFSLGAILYELITGKPHRADAPPPSTLSKCSPEIDAIWRQATHIDPSERTPDAITLQAALTAACAGPKPKAKTPVATPALKPVLRPQSASTNNRKHALTPNSKALSASDNTPPPTLKVGSNWTLVRNLFIIAGLLYAIKIAWSLHQEADQKRKNTSLQTPVSEKKPKPENNRPRTPDPSTRPPIDPSINPAPPKPTASTTPGSLARLRGALASGKRDEMPAGSIRKGPHDYFVVSEPMSWPDAAWFAEQHGGHLAIPSTTAPLSWLIDQPTVGDDIWLGAARNGLNSWALADGTAWLPKKQPSGIGQYLAADKHGFLKAENAKTTHPFIIQWHTDGSNPGALATLLASTRNSLTQPNPKLPPGTRTYGVRHYLFASRPLPWRDAANLAEAAGGHLAVASSIAEISNIGEMTKDLDAENGIWLGAALTNNHWQWITREPWKEPKWADGTNTTLPDSALIIHPQKGWHTQNIADQASGFIIEWSKDRK